MRRATRWSLFAGLAGALALVSGCGPGQGEGPREEPRLGSASQAVVSSAYGFVWADRPTWAVGVPYAATAAYSYNSSGAGNVITHTGVGTYTVEFPNLAESSNAGTMHVVAINGKAERCKTAGWSSSGTSLIGYVACHDPAGYLADSEFVATYYREVLTATDGAYVWNESLSGNASAFWQWNSTGGVNTITHPAPGVYDVTLPGLSTLGGDVQVTAYGWDSEHCKVDFWGVSGGSTVVRVLCFDTWGSPADTLFTLSYFRDTTPMHGHGGYVWADQWATPPSYAPSPAYSWNSFGAPNLAGNIAAGVYQVDYSGIPEAYSTALVTAYGYSRYYCKLYSKWYWYGNGTRVPVVCFDKGAVRVNTQFTHVYMQRP